MASSGKLLVVAIDFGTTYSGYAFSFIHQYNDDPLQISANEAWEAGDRETYFRSLKTPTCLLIDPRDHKTYFGYEAQTKYSDFPIDEVYYFSQFKMKLYEQKYLTLDFKIEDESGKEMKAVDVFAYSIRWLKNHMLRSLENQRTDVRDHEIQWVLTVPAIWNESAKQFMRKAAEEAGISAQSLRIALEPEAASVYCRHLPVDAFESPESPDAELFTSAKPGTRYMVIDLGGGTVDTVVHEVLEGKELKEVIKPSGVPVGGAKVNEEFEKLWKKISAPSGFQAFKSEAKCEYMELGREFEVSKRRAGLGRKYTFRIPAVLRYLCLVTSKLKKEMDVSIVANKIRLPEDAMHKLFQPCIDAIINHIDDLMRDAGTKQVTMLLLVGGFADCSLVQRAIKRYCQTNNLHVIVPLEAELAVLKGAVIYGHRPEVIACRITRYAYGVRTYPTFDPSKHPNEKKEICDGVARCNDIFGKFMSLNQSVKVGDVVKETYKTCYSNQNVMKIAIFASTKPDPEFTTDASCNLIGELHVQLRNSASKPGDKVEVDYIFGCEELFVEAREINTGVCCATSLKIPMEDTIEHRFTK